MCVLDLFGIARNLSDNIECAEKRTLDSSILRRARVPADRTPSGLQLLQPRLHRVMLPAVASPRQPILTRSSTVEGKSGQRKPRSCSLLLLISVLTNVVLAVGLVVLATRSRSSPAALPLSPCASSIDSKVVLPVASELIRCANNSLAAGCDGWSPTPSQWDVEFDFGRHGTVLMRAHRAWQPAYAERFWELSTNGYYIGTPLYRFNYRDPSVRLPR